MDSYVKLGIASLLPVIATIIIYILEKKTKFGKVNYKARQIAIGIVFGLIAVVGTEWGIKFDDSVANCRDAAVLAAGFVFGGPVGIIAGIIGGVERWFAVYWGVGSFTRIACSVSTILAGFYAAAIRKYFLEKKRPSWSLALAFGIVFEVFHLTMVFITNMATPDKAIKVVASCSLPMILANGISTMLSVLAISLLFKDDSNKFKNKRRISQTIQKWLLLTVTLAFVFTTIFLFQLQTQIAKKQADDMLKIAVEEIKSDIKDASDENLISLCKLANLDLQTMDINAVAKKYDLTEINFVNKDGIIFKSTNKDFVGYDMKSGEQSLEFMCLTKDIKSYAQDYGPISKDNSIMRKYAGLQTDYGFLQVGYDSVSFQRDIDNTIVGITKNRHVGTTGYIIIVNEAFEQVSAPEGFKQKRFEGANANSQNLKMEKTFKTEINGKQCYCQFTSAEGYYIVSAIPEDEVMQLRNVAVLVNTYLEILVFFVLFAFVFLIVKIVVVNRIKDVNTSLAKITSGNLNEAVDVRSNAEFASLSDDINSTVDTLKHYIADASARIDKELEFAKSIQSSALPNIFPAFPKRNELDIYAHMDTAKEVGGDFYDFYFTRNNILNFLIADVSGKGIPAAMFMMRAKSELKGLTEIDLPLNEVFTRGNMSLCNGNDAGMFVTAWQGRINLDSGLVQFANAGHNPPIVKHSNGKFELVKARAGFVLAGMEGINYRLQELQLEPGDIIYLYTDGVTEATNINNELYGEERLLNVLNSKDYDSMKELCDTVKKDVDAFAGEAEQFDDITMLALKFIGDLTPHISFDSAKIEDIEKVTDFVNAELERLGCPMKACIQISVAIDELYSNICKFAYPNSDGPVTVQVREVEEPAGVSVTFIDEGVPYNPLVKEDPDVTLSADEREIGGLGIYMVKKSMDDIQYRYENEMNILTITKRF